MPPLRRFHLLIAAALAAGLITLVPTGSHAQPPGAGGVAEVDGRTIYDERYIAGLNVITAEDILKRIPGIQDLLTDAQTVSTQRGFGSSGAQILFDGRRLSTKNISVASALARIQASQVRQVEIIRGSLPGMDVRAEGVLVNIVLKEALTAASGSWEGRYSNYSGTGVKVGGKLAYSGTIGALDYAASVDITPKFDRRDRFNLFYWITQPPLRVPDTLPFLRQEEDYKTEGTDHIAAGSLTYAFANGDIANLNARFAEQGQREELPSDNFDLIGGRQIFVRQTNNIRDLEAVNWEVGGDFEHFFSGDSSAKFLAIYADTRQNDEREFFVTPAGRPVATTRIQLQYPDRTEKILRGTYRSQPPTAHGFEIGAEIAENTLDTRIQLLTVANGIASDVQLFNPSAVVKELRLESFATYSWRPAAGLSVDIAADTESSRLTQTGRDANSRRNFFFVKPRLDIRYAPASGLQIRARIQRSISQLNFADFVAGFNTEASRLEVLRAGNPALAPEKQWLYELTYEHRLPSDQGVATVRGYYIDVSDRIEQIPVGATIQAATGNIGQAKNYGIEGKIGLRLGWLGLSGATLEATAYTQRSRASDAFTGERRIFARLPTGNWSATFRHDTDWRGFAYGVTVANRDHDFFIEPNTILDYNPRRFASTFAEVKTVADITARIEVNRIGASGARGERYYWAGRRGLSGLDRVELIKSHFTEEMRFTLRGSF